MWRWCWNTSSDVEISAIPCYKWAWFCYACNHKQYSKVQSLKKKWIDKKSVAYDCTEKIILILKFWGEPYHTGSLEVFHSLINVYATKSQKFDFTIMNARVDVAVLDHNNNFGRRQYVIKKEGRKTSNGVFLPVNYLITGLLDQLWSPNHTVLLMI